MNKIIIGAPANRFTGGPTLAHQLCRELIELGYNAKMYYYNKKGEKVVHEIYQSLSLPYITTLYDDAFTVYVAPETNPDMLKKIKKGVKVIWWMSVDNYFDKYLRSNRNLILNILGFFKFNITEKQVFHFAQSYYAIDFLKSINIAEEKIFFISDYLDDAFINGAKSHTKENRSNIILYSPKRGLELTQDVMEVTKQFEWIPLINMNQNEMIVLMQRSKLYVDFGNHPGKDRIPREAAINGCCVITGTLGSANNVNDINITEVYKIKEGDSFVKNAHFIINDVMMNYELHYERFEGYRSKIQNEEILFSSSVKRVFAHLADLKR